MRKPAEPRQALERLDGEFFADRVRELVQETEDALHGSPTDANGRHLAVRMTALWLNLCCEVATFYWLPPPEFTEPTMAGGIVCLKGRFSKEFADVVAVREPTLWAAMSHPELCVCQTIPGIRHSH